MDAQNRADDAQRNGGHISKAEGAALRNAAELGDAMKKVLLTPDAHSLCSFLANSPRLCMHVADPVRLEELPTRRAALAASMEAVESMRAEMHDMVQRTRALKLADEAIRQRQQRARQIDDNRRSAKQQRKSQLRAWRLTEWDKRLSPELFLCNDSSAFFPLFSQLLSEEATSMCNRLLPRALALVDTCEDEEEDGQSTMMQPKHCGHCGSSYPSQGGAMRARLEASMSHWPHFILTPHFDTFLKQRAEQHEQVASERLGMEVEQGQADPLDPFAEEGGAYDDEDEEEDGVMEEKGGPIATNDVEGDEDEFEEQDEQ
jgi:hypothetical protein